MIGPRVFFIAASMGFLLAGCETRRPHAFDARCWIRGDDGRLTVLDANVENLETCGARLLVRYIQGERPVSGSFGGVDVFVDANVMEAATPYGDYRIPLVSMADRKRIEAATRRLLASQPALATEVGHGQAGVPGAL